MKKTKRSVTKREGGMELYWCVVPKSVSPFVRDQIGVWFTRLAGGGTRVSSLGIWRNPETTEVEEEHGDVHFALCEVSARKELDWEVLHLLLKPGPGSQKAVCRGWLKCEGGITYAK
jgi:hypothetical protein